MCQLTQRGNPFSVHTCQITTMYIKYLTISCQLYLNKAEKKLYFNTVFQIPLILKVSGHHFLLMLHNSLVSNSMNYCCFGFFYPTLGFSFVYDQSCLLKNFYQIFHLYQFQKVALSG